MLIKCNKMYYNYHVKIDKKQDKRKKRKVKKTFHTVSTKLVWVNFIFNMRYYIHFILVMYKTDIQKLHPY